MSNKTKAPLRQGGFTIVELMIALVLGLLVVGAAGAAFLANRRVYAASETLNRVQENGRVSFELLARDVREAGGSPCGNRRVMETAVNMLNNQESPWWLNFGDGIRGYEGGTGVPIGNAAPGTDALDLYLLSDPGDVSIVDHDNAGGVMTVTNRGSLRVNDIAIACNAEVAMIFQITGFPSSNKVQFQQGGQAAPGNCDHKFRVPDPANGKPKGRKGCDVPLTNDNMYCFTSSPSGPCGLYSKNWPASIVGIGAVRWYVADNGRGSRSLYRGSIMDTTSGGTPTLSSPEEIAEGIVDMQLEYRRAGSTAWANASAIPAADWPSVEAVQIVLVSEGVRGAFQGRDIRGAAANDATGDALRRTFRTVVALRNSNGVL